MQQKTVTTDILDIAYREYGAPDGWPCIMGHGFPYDVNAYAETAPIMAQAGARVLVPWLRGYGPTRFRSAATLRSGEQAALGADLLAFMDALGIARAVVGGYDWGGRAACVVSVLHPERVIALVSGNSYNIQNIARSMEPALRHRRRRHSGINISSTTNAAAVRWSATGAVLRASSGRCGRRDGPSTTRRSRPAPSRSTLPISSMS
ncbi:pimeloyl-ACP methyl ester carboxylesterase [Bradyrhizobium sp. GM22.5]